jgi:hypothetical protein
MSPAPLVDHGEELEVNLIEAPCEMDDERRTVIARDHPGHEAIRQTPLDQFRRSAVQPVFIKVEVSRNERPGGHELARERLRKTQLALVRDGKEIHVPCRTPDEAKRREGRAADHHHFHMAVQGVQLLTQCAE